MVLPNIFGIIRRALIRVLFSHKPTQLNRKFVTELFKNQEYFKLYHEEDKDYSDTNEFIIEF